MDSNLDVMDSSNIYYASGVLPTLSNKINNLVVKRSDNVVDKSNVYVDIDFTNSNPM
jgi:hypothetical protein